MQADPRGFLGDAVSCRRLVDREVLHRGEPQDLGLLLPDDALGQCLPDEVGGRGLCFPSPFSRPSKTSQSQQYSPLAGAQMAMARAEWFPIGNGPDSDRL